MSNDHALYPGHADLRGRVGAVIPAWFSPSTPVSEAERLLLTTLADSPSCLEPGDVVLVVDGSEVAQEAARHLHQRLGREWSAPFALVELPRNVGKGGALVRGLRRLLEREDRAAPEWIATRDADGDHFVDDLPHLFRAGVQAAQATGSERVCVIGRRAGVHAPLGWIRGEFELLLNEVLVDAVAFARARAGGAWDCRFLADRVPDIQSGYKLYSRSAAAAAAAALEGQAAAHPDLGLLRTGMEIVPWVTLALEGGVFAEAERRAFYDQPVTSYGQVDLARFYGSKLAWALLRCGVPPAAAALMLDGAAVRRPLYADPAGRAAVQALRALVLDTLCAGPWPGEITAEPRGRRYL